MVQKDGFAISLKKPTGESFPEVLDPSTGDVYAVASPGELFVIHYDVLSERRQRARDGDTKMYRFRTTVDGKRVGINERTRDTADCPGFVRTG